MLTNDSDQDQVVNFFHWETDFDGIVLIDDTIYPNTYNVKISFLPKTSEIKLQNNSFERIKYFFHKICENSIILQPGVPLESTFFKMPVNKILLPGNPYDQLLGITCFHKLKAIAGKYLHIGQLTVDSKLGDNVQYTVDSDSYENINLQHDAWVDKIIPEPWWDRNDTASFDQVLGPKEYWQGAKSWRELGYGSNAPQKTFNPTIIDGGRT